MVQATQDGVGHHAEVLWNLMPVCLERYGKVGRRLRNTWPQGHARAACVIMPYPCRQKTSQVVLGERDHEIQAFSPECPQQPFTEGIGLGTVRWRFQHPQPQMANPLVESL
jgi:hypothetical protein